MNNPQSPTSQTTENSSTTNEAAIDLFFKMAMYYQKLWTRDYGNYPTDEFLVVFNKIGSRHVDRALSNARESLSKGDKFPPHVGMLISWCTTPSQSEYGAILQRVLSNEPQDSIEKYLCDHYRYNLKRMNESLIDVKFKRLYTTASEMCRNGKLSGVTTPPKSLPKQSTSSLSDRAREEFAHSKRSHRFKNRIEALIGSSKCQSKGEQGKDRSKQPLQ